MRNFLLVSQLHELQLLAHARAHGPFGVMWAMGCYKGRIIGTELVREHGINRRTAALQIQNLTQSFLIPSNYFLHIIPTLDKR